MLVPDMEGSHLLIFRERGFPVHVPVARQNEDCIDVFHSKGLGESAVQGNCIRHFSTFSTRCPPRARLAANSKCESSQTPASNIACSSCQSSLTLSIKAPYPDQRPLSCGKRI